jgi:hypothetical protein
MPLFLEEFLGRPPVSENKKSGHFLVGKSLV